MDVRTFSWLGGTDRLRGGRSPNWPVYSMIAGPWNNRPAYYRPFYLNPGDCNNDVVHCVPVRNINDPNRARGVTSFSVNFDTSHIVHGSMTVEYNNAYNIIEDVYNH